MKNPMKVEYFLWLSLSPVRVMCSQKGSLNHCGCQKSCITRMTSCMLVEEKREHVMQDINFSCSYVSAPWLCENPSSWQLLLTLLGLVQMDLCWWRMWEREMRNEDARVSSFSVHFLKKEWFFFLLSDLKSYLALLFRLCWVHAGGHGSVFFEDEWKQQPIKLVLAAFVSSGCPRKPPGLLPVCLLFSFPFRSC